MTIPKPISPLFKSLGISSQLISLDNTNNRLTFTLTVSEVDSGILIGRHGETIDALQTLVSLMLNHDKVKYRPVVVDINGYRQKRLDYVVELSQKAAGQAVESGREIILPELSPFERRHAHLTLKDDPRVTTYSEGEGSLRRLIVRPV